MNLTRRIVLLLSALAVIAVGLVIVGLASKDDRNESAAADHNTVTDQLTALRDPDVPDLPFDDNPDPSQCGIPELWGRDDPAWLTGTYDGDLVQPTVLLYNSHNRLSITGQAAHGTQVEVVMFQSNPVLNYYFVRVPGTQNADGSPNEGWVPAPFLSFDPVEPLPGSAPDDAATG